MSGLKRILMAVLGLCLVCAAAGCTLPVLSQRPVTVESREVVSQTDALVVNMKIPVVGGIEDEALQARINAELENAARKEREEITRLARVGEKLPGTTYELHWDYRATFNKNGILSLVTTSYQYTGGAHGMTVQESYTYDLIKGEKMSLAAIFQPGVDYQKVINEEVEKQMVSDPDKFPAGVTDFQGIAENQPYYLEEGSLVVYFGLYEIAPYVSGIPEFTIPFTRFDGGVRAELLE